MSNSTDISVQTRPPPVSSVNPDPEVVLGFKETFIEILADHSHRSREDIAAALAASAAATYHDLYEQVADQVRLHGMSAVS
jgi:hypothetical protein